MISTNKRPVENFLVTKPAVATIPTSGNLVTAATNVVNLADGQLGLVSDSSYGSVAPNVFLDATPTLLEAPVMKIYQGNENSASPNTATSTYPLWVRPYEQTAPIDGRSHVTVTKQNYRLPSHSIWILGNTSGQANAINVLDNTVYQVQLALRGYRVESQYSSQEAASVFGSVTTPDFTSLGTSTALAIDYITTYLAYNVNRNSKALSLNTRFAAKSPVVAFLISSAAGSGTSIGTGSPIAAGTVIPVITSSTGTRNIVLTDAMATSIKNAAVAASGVAIASLTWTILTIDLATAGSATGGTADMVMFMALDETAAYVDYIPQTKVRLQVGLNLGFNSTTVRNAEYTFADEGQGSARSLELLYQETQGQRKYNLRHIESPAPAFASPIDSTQTYVVYNINHGFQSQIDTNTTSYSPFREIICIPRYSVSTTTNPLIAAFDTVINSWLGSSVNNGAIINLV